MGIFSKIFGQSNKEKLSFIDFIRTLVIFIVDFEGIEKTLKEAKIPVERQQHLRDEIMYLYVFSTEVALCYKLDTDNKSMVMSALYKELLSYFEKAQEFMKEDLNLVNIIKEGLNRRMPEYHLNMKNTFDNENNFSNMKIGKTFAKVAGYSDDPHILVLGEIIAKNHITAVLGLWVDFEIEA